MFIVMWVRPTTCLEKSSINKLYSTLKYLSLMRIPVRIAVYAFFKYFPPELSSIQWSILSVWSQHEKCIRTRTLVHYTTSMIFWSTRSSCGKHPCINNYLQHYKKTERCQNIVMTITAYHWEWISVTPEETRRHHRLKHRIHNISLSLTYLITEYHSESITLAYELQRQQSPHRIHGSSEIDQQLLLPVSDSWWSG